VLVEQLVQRLAPTRDAVRGATPGATRGGSAFAPPADGQRRAAVAAVLHDEPAGPRVLLMKRAERAGDPWSGHISLPGGGYQADDPDLLATAIRETHEELGIVLGPEQLVGSLSPLAPRTAGPTLVEVSPFVFRTRVALDPISGALDSSHVYARGGTTLTFPSWTYEGHVIWGLTRRILDDLVALAR